MRGQLELTPTYAAQLGGKILANAHAVGDVDGDGGSELIFGSTTGNVVVYKIVGDRLSQWRSCEVDGSVTSICLDTTAPGDTRIVVATAEGTCFVLRSVDNDTQLQSCAEISVELNVCDLVLFNDELIVGTRSGHIFSYRSNLDGTGGYTQLAQVEVSGEVEELLVLQNGTQNVPQLLVRCVSGEVFCTSEFNPEQSDVTLWNTAARNEDDAAFIVGDVELDGDRGLTAHAFTNGSLLLFSSSWEKRWDVELPDALVSADKLEMTLADGTRRDAIVACTWSGQLFAVQSEQALVRFRMILPASSMFCVSIHDGSGQVDPTVVGVTTSGIILVYRDVQETLMRGLQDATLADKVRQSAVFSQLDTPEKRQAVLDKLQSAFPTALSPATAEKEGEAPSVEEMVRAMLAVPA